MTPRPSIRMADVQTAVASAFAVPHSSLGEPRPVCRSRKRYARPNCYQISRARQAAMYLARKLNDPRDERYSYSNIGRWFGGRDHSTVIYGIRRVEERRTRDPELAGKLEEIEWRLL